MQITRISERMRCLAALFAAGRARGDAPIGEATGAG
jgi:hypothetical protein